MDLPLQEHATVAFWGGGVDPHFAETQTPPDFNSKLEFYSNSFYCNIKNTAKANNGQINKNYTEEDDSNTITVFLIFWI